MIESHDETCGPAPVQDLSQNAGGMIRRYPADADLTARLIGCDDILLSGWIGLGKRNAAANNLIGVLLPGDRTATVLDGSLCSAVALTPVSLTSEEKNDDEPREFRHLVRQCVRTSHLNALDRIEDFFRETYERLAAMDMARDRTFDFPLSQATLGNILGLSTAHVNRVIKQLQAEGRVRIAGRTVTLPFLEATGFSVFQNCTA